jgi:hypothetical protein
MSYYLSVRLKQTKYSGSNIGREVKFKLELGNQVTEKSIRLPFGKSRYFDEVLYQGTLQEKVILLSITAEAREINEIL